MLLITGITGHSGTYFLQELIYHNYSDPIRCIVRATSDTGYLDNCSLNIEKRIGDVKDSNFLNECMIGVTTVVHIVNIRHSLAIVEAAIKNNVSRVICVHTTGIFSGYRNASDEYKDIELNLSKMLTQSKLKLTILRPTMIYGDLCDHNISKFIMMVDRFRIFPVIEHGKSLIQPVNARDLGKAYYNVLSMPVERAKAEYILSGEKPIQLVDALKMISECLHKKTIFISFPLSLGVFFARTLKFLTFGKVDYIEKVQRMGEDRSFPHSDAKVDLGYSPIAFNQGISMEVNEYLKEKRRQ